MSLPNVIEIKEPQGSQAWLDARKGCIGGTGVKHVLKFEKADYENDMFVRSLFEGTIFADRYATMVGRKGENLVRIATRPILSERQFVPRCFKQKRAQTDVMVSLDGLWEGDGKREILEVKTTTFEGKPWRAYQQNTIPADYWHQVQLYMYITGAELCWFFVAATCEKDWPSILDGTARHWPGPIVPFKVKKSPAWAGTFETSYANLMKAIVRFKDRESGGGKEPPLLRPLAEKVAEAKARGGASYRDTKQLSKHLVEYMMAEGIDSCAIKDTILSREETTEHAFNMVALEAAWPQVVQLVQAGHLKITPNTKNRAILGQMNKEGILLAQAGEPRLRMQSLGYSTETKNVERVDVRQPSA